MFLLQLSASRSSPRLCNRFPSISINDHSILPIVGSDKEKEEDEDEEGEEGDEDEDEDDGEEENDDDDDEEVVAKEGTRYGHNSHSSTFCTYVSASGKKDSRSSMACAYRAGV